MRWLALISPGTNARSQLMDLLRGVALAGHEVLFEDTALFVAAHQKLVAAAGNKVDDAARRLQASFARHIERTFRARGCDVAIGLWADPLLMLPMLSRPGGAGRCSFVRALGIPMVHWWLDAPFWAYESRALPMLDRDFLTDPTHIHLINNEGTAEEMRRVLGLRSVVALPYGIDDSTFRPWDGITIEFDLAINAGPGDAPATRIMLAELEKDDPDVSAIRNDQADRARDAMLRTAREAGVTFAEPLVDAWLRQQLAQPDRPMLEKFEAAHREIDAPPALIEALTARPTSPGVWAAMTASLRTIENWQRAFTAAYLSRRFKCLIIGEPSPSWRAPAVAGGAACCNAGADMGGWGVQGAWAGNVPYHELALCYSRCRAGLNIMRYQDDIGLNPKALEIASSGALLLQRWRRGIDDMFTEGSEILTFTTPSEAAMKLRAALSANDGKRSMCHAARARIERDHAWSIRAQSLIRDVRGILGP